MSISISRRGAALPALPTPIKTALCLFTLLYHAAGRADYPAHEYWYDHDGYPPGEYTLPPTGNGREENWHSRFPGHEDMVMTPAYCAYHHQRLQLNCPQNGCGGAFYCHVEYACDPGDELVGNTCIEDEDEPDEDCTDNPVHFTTGNKSITETDLRSTGNQTFRFSRHWNSQRKTWQFSYRQKVVYVAGPPEVVYVFTESGWPRKFTKIGPQWVADTERGDALIHNTPFGAWQYTDAAGDRYWFDAQGQVSRIIDRGGVEIGVAPLLDGLQISDDYDNYMLVGLDGAGNVIRMTDPDGQEYQYAYNTDGNLEYVSYPDDTPDTAGSNPFGEDNPVRRYHYAAGDPDLLTAITDENGDLYKTVTYDADGRALTSGLADGAIGQSSFDYTHLDDATDPRVTVTNALGRDTVYHLESHEGMRKVGRIEGLASANCLADVQTREYYADTGWLKRETDRAGNATFYDYYTDPARYGLLRMRVEGEGSAAERSFTFDWDDNKRKIRETLVGHRRTDYSYHPDGRLHTLTRTDLSSGAAPYPTAGNTQTWTWTYTFYPAGTHGGVASMTVDGPRQPSDAADITTTEYSFAGNVTRIVTAAGHETLYQNHNGRGQPGRVVDANGVVTDIGYGPRGRVEWITRDVDGANATTDFHYDTAGQLTGITLPDGVTWQFEYDAAHRLTAVQNGLGERVAYTLDADGNRVAVHYRDAGGALARDEHYVFDELGRLIGELGSNQQAVAFQYDERGHIVAIDDGVNPPSYPGYDGLNRMDRLTDANNNLLQLDYAATDALAQVTDQRGLATRYTYDGLGNLIQRDSPDTGITTYWYDAAGNRTAMEDARGIVTQYSYDALNRVTAVQYPDTALNVAYTYDDTAGCAYCIGQLSHVADASGDTHFTYDALGQLDTRTHAVHVPGAAQPVALLTDFDFNGAGRLQQIRYPGGREVAFQYDAAGQVSGITQRGSEPGAEEVALAEDIDFAPFGAVSGIDYGNGLQLARQYDLDGRLAAQHVGDVQALAYHYDRANNIVAIDNTVDSTRAEEFTYDNLNRLIGATGRYGAIAYGYDAVGNRLSRNINRDGGSVHETYQYAPDSNRLREITLNKPPGPPLKREFLYDETGNLIEEQRADGTFLLPRYDDSNRMHRVEP